MLKNYGNKIFNLKTDLEHYALSDECIVFFKSLPPVFKIGHLFLSIFQKGPLRVEISIHHHSFGVRLPFFAMLPLWFGYIFTMRSRDDHNDVKHKT
jgi:hypothetical protein